MSLDGRMFTTTFLRGWGCTYVLIVCPCWQNRIICTGLCPLPTLYQNFFRFSSPAIEKLSQLISNQWTKWQDASSQLPVTKCSMLPRQWTQISFPINHIHMLVFWLGKGCCWERITFFCSIFLTGYLYWVYPPKCLPSMFFIRFVFPQKVSTPGNGNCQWMQISGNGWK